MTETLATMEMAQGEGKWFRFLVTRDGSAIDVTALECSFVVAQSYDDAEYLLEKETADFDKSLGATGVLRMNITSGESLAFNEGTYKAELKVVLSGEAGEEVDIRRNVDFKIRESLFA
jgi:hypothetical protein